MAVITITGTIKDPNGTLPTSGTITFLLDQQMVAAAGHIIAVKPETATIDGSGNFSITLESTTTSTPSNRSYRATLNAIIEGQTVVQEIGTFALAGTPSTQLLSDLIIAASPSSSATLSFLTISTLRLNNIRYADQFTGANANAKIAAAIADLPSTGGTVDARGLEGTQAWSADPFTSITKPVTLLLGAATHAISVDVTVPTNVTIEFVQGSILSMNSGKTMMFNGCIVAGLTQLFAGSGTVYVQTPLVPKIYPQWYGAKGDGATANQHLIFRKMLISGGSQSVFSIPHGDYLFNTDAPSSGVAVALDISNHYMEFAGGGVGATRFTFNPTNADLSAEYVCFRYLDSSIMGGGRMADFEIYSADSTHHKIGIELNDLSDHLLERIKISGGVGHTSANYWSGGGVGSGDSIGIRIRGREFIEIRDCELICDRPYFFGKNPHGATLPLDHITVKRSYNIAYYQPHYEFEDGVPFQSIEIEGSEPLVRGTYGVLISSTGHTTQANRQLTLKNFRKEESDASNIALVHIEMTTETALKDLVMEDMNWSDLNGMFFRNVINPRLLNLRYEGTGTAWDVDSTVTGVNMQDVHFDPAATISDSGATYVMQVSPGHGFDVGIQLILSGIINATSLSGDVDNWNPTGLAGAFIIRTDTNGAARNVTGLVGGAKGRCIRIYSVSPTYNLVLKHESGSSTAANRFQCPNAADYTVRPYGAVDVQYDHFVSRWRVIAG